MQRRLVEGDDPAAPRMRGGLADRRRGIHLMDQEIAADDEVVFLGAVIVEQVDFLECHMVHSRFDGADPGGGDGGTAAVETVDPALGADQPGGEEADVAHAASEGEDRHARPQARSLQQAAGDRVDEARLEAERVGRDCIDFAHAAHCKYFYNIVNVIYRGKCGLTLE